MSIEEQQQSGENADVTASASQEENSPTPLRLVSELTYPAPNERPYWACYHTQQGRFAPGVWHHDKEADTHVCAPLEVEALTESKEEGFGMLLTFVKRKKGGEKVRWLMPIALTGGKPEELNKALMTKGLRIFVDKDQQQRALVQRFLNSLEPERTVTVTHDVGWHDTDDRGYKTFVLPGEVIAADGADDVFFSGDTNPQDFRKAGTIEGWQHDIGALLPGNPLLMLAVGVGLAGPLLDMVGELGGGFHIVGASSTGKTTLAEVLASVWGKPSGFVLKWNATANGIEAVAASRNDTVLALDEIGIADSYDVSRVVYSVCDGTGRQRAQKDGTTAHRPTWRTLLFSTGEITLETKMGEAGKRTQAGQAVRLATLEATRPYGAWDALHSFQDGGELSKALRHSAASHYGHMGPAFVRTLLESGTTRAEIIEDFRDCLATFKETNGKSLTGQPERVAQRFALVAVALELAVRLGLLPLAQGEAHAAMAGLFHDWLATNGTGPSEAQRILTAIRDFIDRHAARFQSTAVGSVPVPNRAGFFECDGGSALYLFTKGGLEEATAGFEPRQVQKVLSEAGAIVRGEDGTLTRKKSVNGERGRFYFINPEKLQHK